MVEGRTGFSKVRTFGKTAFLIDAGTNGWCM